jgi:hypothetical protein
MLGSTCLVDAPRRADQAQASGTAAVLASASGSRPDRAAGRRRPVRAKFGQRLQERPSRSLGRKIALIPPALAPCEDVDQHRTRSSARRDRFSSAR